MCGSNSHMAIPALQMSAHGGPRDRTNLIVEQEVTADLELFGRNLGPNAGCASPTLSILCHSPIFFKYGMRRYS